MEKITNWFSSQGNRFDENPKPFITYSEKRKYFQINRFSLICVFTGIRTKTANRGGKRDLALAVSFIGRFTEIILAAKTADLCVRNAAV